ncbi:MAG: GIY-YIG nuclease family protein [Candidatus Zixiibacteriota bacterium]
MKRPCVYILKCVDGLYYTGSTTNLEQRLRQHEAGVADSFTARRLPVELVYCLEFQTIREAAEAEKRIKDWSRAKKEALMRNDTDALKALSACKNASHYQRSKS